MDDAIINNILDRIYTHGNRMLIFQDLFPIEKEDHISLICPKCGLRSALYSYHPESKHESRSIECKRTDSCDYHADFIQYISGKRNPKGKDFIKAVLNLAKKTGIGITDNQLISDNRYRKSGSNPEKNNSFDPFEKSVILKYKAMTLDAVGIDYLELRGISIETAVEFGIKFAPWGRWPHCIRDNISGDKRLIRQWHPGRLVIPIYNNEGKLKSLYGRAIPGYQEPPKKIRHDFIGLEKGIFNQAALKEETVYITEGAFDALSIIEAGKQEGKKINACAIFGITGLKWELVKSKNIIFCFDSDKAGNEWIKLARHGIKHSKHIMSLNRDSYQNFKDLSELWMNKRKIEFRFSEYLNERKGFT